MKDRNTTFIYLTSFIKEAINNKNKVKVIHSLTNWYNTKIIFNSNNSSDEKYNIPINIFKKGVYIRHWAFGDKCFSNYYNSYVSVSNLFINNKISRFSKCLYPLIVDSNNEILLIPGIYSKFYGQSDAEQNINVTWN